LKADSAITVWDTFGHRPSISKRGMMMAGSVEASTAPIISATRAGCPRRSGDDHGDDEGGYGDAGQD
jgi:hypothetical protein